MIKKNILIVVMMVGMSYVSQADDWYDDNWLFRQKITVNHNSVSNDQVNFPVLITGTNVQAGLWAHALSNGYDIVFTASDGQTKLAHQIEKYDATPGSNVFWSWVKAPLLSSTNDTILYMYYGKSGASSQQNITGVWDNAFVGVWHLNELSGTNYDSTANGNGARPTNGVLQNVAGQIDGANDYTGTNLSMTTVFESGLGIDTNSFSVSAWHQRHILGGGSAAMNIVGDAYDAGATNFNGFRLYLNEWGYISRIADGQTNRVAGSYNFTQDTNIWHYVMMTWDKVNSQQLLYHDGNPVNTNTCVGHVAGVSAPSGNCIQFGGHYNSGQFNGIIDEIRISATVRSAGWIKTEYNNQNSPFTFSSSSTEEQWRPRGTIFTIY